MNASDAHRLPYTLSLKTKYPSSLLITVFYLANENYKHKEKSTLTYKYRVILTWLANENKRNTPGLGDCNTNH
jgi:hypothetical protein